MNVVLQRFLIIAILIYFVILVYLISRKSLNLKYTLLWIFSGIVMFIMVLFPAILEDIIKFLGIVDLTNGLFALLNFFIMLILMSMTGIVSKINDKNKALVQQCALLEKRIRELENNKNGVEV